MCRYEEYEHDVVNVFAEQSFGPEHGLVCWEVKVHSRYA
jgi:hypothetical protein